MSLEDLYKDLGIIDGDVMLDSLPLPAFSFPELPPAFTTDNDKENWNILGDALNKSSKQVSILDDLVKDLVSVSDRFRYIGDSVKWLKLELERMCQLPPLVAEQNDGLSQSDEEEDEEDDKYLPTSNNMGAEVDDISETFATEAGQAEEAFTEIPSAQERMFKPSGFYDWSEIEDDVHLLQEIVIMNPLMAIYEVLDAKPFSDDGLDQLFAQPPLVDWDGTNDDALLDVLKSLTDSFIEWQRSQSEEPSAISEKAIEETGGSCSIEQMHTYPSPRITNAHEIRVLELLPGSMDDPIHCLLSIEHIWDDPRYKALSYVWGTATDTRSIQLNEVAFNITNNLEVALRHLRDEIEPQRLWIDALCINQNDPIEKQAQVQLMSEIYPAADRVLCWLGPEADDSDYVFQEIQQVADSNSDEGDSDFNPRKESWHDIGDRFAQGLFMLESRQWWSRLWTCQESALTLKDPIITCGMRSISWPKYRRVSQLQIFPMSLLFPSKDSNPRGDGSSEFWKGIANLTRLHAAYILRGKRGRDSIDRSVLKHPISSMAILTRRHHCSDPRDKLYGILSFLLEPYRVLLPPNYTQSLELVTQKYTATVLMVSKSGLIYDHLPIRRGLTPRSPSWALDLSPQDVEMDTDPLLHPAKVTKDCATKGRNTQCISIGPRLLIRGIVLEEIKMVKNIQDEETPDPTQLFARLSEFECTAMDSRAQGLKLNNPTSRFQHLRKGDSFLEFVTYGVYQDDTDRSALEPATISEDKEEEAIKAIVRSDTLVSDIDHVSQPPPSAETERFDIDLQTLCHAMLGKKFITTDSGFFGIGASDIQEGDLVVLLFGFNTPMVLRQHGHYFSLVGGARIGGIMQGQLMEFVDDGTLAERTFEIR
ncbi:hypothetical protein VTL71DRAFT_10383 [Oculimacula yallundae]|uniref:Heterokaryon incompatibility domain-containing protein n=1 Tax=Oculimacula yallundae TaxID=86028 RepID=A0ABR4CSU8_9HELO